MLRGGSFNNRPQNCRSAYRNYNRPGDANRNNGFRVVLSAPEPVVGSRGALPPIDE